MSYQSYQFQAPPLNRTTTSSTTSTMYSPNAFGGSMASSQTSVHLTNRNSPKLMSPSGLGPGRFPRKNSGNSSESAGSRSSSDQDLDNWGYLYSLRVACV